MGEPEGEIVRAEAAKRVLVATDFSEGSERSLTVAIGFARALGAAIDLVHIHPVATTSAVSAIPGIVAVPPPDQDALDEVRRRLDEIAAGVRSCGVDCLTFSSVGDVAEEIIAHADRIAADFIVMGTHGRTGVRRVLLGSAAEDVLRNAHRPMLIVPPARETAA